MNDEQAPLQFSARDLMPDWAQEKPAGSETSHAKRFADEEERRGGDRRGGPRRDDDRRGGGGRRDDRGRNDRFSRPDNRRDGDRREGGRREGGDRRDHGGRGERGGFRGGDRRGGPRDRDREHERPRPEAAPTGIAVALEPSGPAIEGLAHHIRETFRVFALSDLAKTVLGARERYQARFTASDPAKLYRCPADGSLWLSREEALAHLLSSPALETWYEVEDVEVEAPSGNYSSIAVCGMSGTILGPPNHHEYQRNIARLHRERFSNLSLERFKSRIQMESGEEIVEKWKALMSRVRQYRVRSAEEEGQVEAPEEIAVEDVIEEAPVEAETPVEAEEAAVEVAADEPADAAGAETVESEEATEAVTEETPAPAVAETPAKTGLLLKSVEELARHFRQHFADEAVVECSEAVVSGNIPGRSLSPALLGMLKNEGERLRRSFPLPMIQALCRDLEKSGLKFFKRGKKALHVSAVRPKPLDESVSLTEQVQRIVDHVKTQRHPKVAGLLAALDPDFKQPEGDQAGDPIELTDASKTILKDLRWLTAEGYLLEFPDTSLAIGRPRTEAPAQETKETKAAPKQEKRPKKSAAAEAPQAKAALPETAPAAPAPEFDDETSDPHDPYELPESVDPVETF